MAPCTDITLQPEASPEPHANAFTNDWSDLLAPWNTNVLSFDRADKTGHWCDKCIVTNCLFHLTMSTLVCWIDLQLLTFCQPWYIVWSWIHFKVLQIQNLSMLTGVGIWISESLNGLIIDLWVFTACTVVGMFQHFRR